MNHVEQAKALLASKAKRGTTSCPEGFTLCPSGLGDSSSEYGFEVSSFVSVFAHLRHALMTLFCLHSASIHKTKWTLVVAVCRCLGTPERPLEWTAPSCRMVRCPAREDVWSVTDWLFPQSIKFGARAAHVGLTLARLAPC